MDQGKEAQRNVRRVGRARAFLFVLNPKKRKHIGFLFAVFFFFFFICFPNSQGLAGNMILTSFGETKSMKVCNKKKVHESRVSVCFS